MPKPLRIRILRLAVGAVILLGVAVTQAAQPKARILGAAKSCEANALTLIERMVNMDSGSIDAAGLAALSSLLKTEFESIGAVVESVPSAVPGYSPSLVASVTGTGKGRILLIAHIDTVFQKGTAAERPYKVIEGRGVGPGAGDDKQGVAVGWCALRVLSEIGFTNFSRVDFILNSNEEVGSPGSRQLIAAKARQSDVVLNLERGVPPDAVVVARKGSATATLEIHGRAAHSGLEPEKGRNAVLEAVNQVQQLTALANPALETTANVTVLQGGHTKNVIPDRATITVDVRAFTAAEFDRVDSELQRIARNAVVPDVKVTASLTRGFPPWPRSRSTDALLAQAQRVYAEIGHDLSAIVVGSSSDVSVAAETGTPSIDGFGAVSGGAHGVEDHVLLSSITPRIYLLARMIMENGAKPMRRP